MNNNIGFCKQICIIFLKISCKNKATLLFSFRPQQYLECSRVSVKSLRSPLYAAPLLEARLHFIC